MAARGGRAGRPGDAPESSKTTNSPEDSEVPHRANRLAWLPRLVEDLQAHSQLDQVMTLVFSEFDRHVEENASRGTDHGAAAPVFLVGDHVQSGIIGKHPRLDDLTDGDLKFQLDFRAVYSAILTQWLGWPAAPILGDGFPPADVLQS